MLPLIQTIVHICHENGTHEIKPSQWETSVHANGPYQFAGPSRYTCTPCHNGEGFIQYVKGQPQSADVIVPITCATCHDPHSKENSHQLRDGISNIAKR